MEKYRWLLEAVEEIKKMSDAEFEVLLAELAAENEERVQEDPPFDFYLVGLSK